MTVSGSRIWPPRATSRAGWRGWSTACSRSRGRSTSTPAPRPARASGSSYLYKRLGPTRGSAQSPVTPGKLVLLAAVEQLADQARDGGEVLRLVQEVVRSRLERG